MSGLTWLKTVNAVLFILITFIGTIDFNKLHPIFNKFSTDKDFILIILAIIYIVLYIIEIDKTQTVEILNKKIYQKVRDIDGGFFCFFLYGKEEC